jgi:hypothetical protein
MRQAPVRSPTRTNGPGRQIAVTVGYLSLWGVWQPETNWFSRARIKRFGRAGPSTSDFRYIMNAKERTLVKRTSVGERVLATRLVDMEANHLVADWAFGGNRVKALASRHLGEFAKPNVKLPHGLRPS